MTDDLSRREALKLVAMAPFALRQVAGRRAAGFSEAFAQAPWRVIATNGEPAPRVRIMRAWGGDVCRSRIVNEGRHPVRLRELVIFDAVRHGLAPETPFYGEGMQMLTQTGGTIGQPIDLGNYTDPKHYKLPEPAGAKTVYGLAMLGTNVVAFGSCRRFNGKFNVRPSTIQVVLEAEDQELGPGASWELEEIIVLEGRPEGRPPRNTAGLPGADREPFLQRKDRVPPEHNAAGSPGADREGHLARVADRLNANHPPLRFAAPPSGWCSWYCFGPNVTAKQVLDNLDVIARRIPGLRYIQIDDGYQPAMGDWLDTGTAFGGNVQDVLREIRKRRFEPAIWVAPFIAEKGSKLFGEHPDWFVKDASGAPLASNTVTFGGWRRGPWYVVDGTHPEAQKHLEHVFRTMRTEWGCTYFKLDANFWGAIHGGRFHDPAATRIEAYRRGMQAVLRGAGDAFILGCNHPIWASTGVIHGSRSSNDIKRTWERIATTGKQNLYRNWQNGRLWWNDPDAVVLTGDLPENELRFHASVIFASGGMILAGDDLTTIAPARLDMLRRLQPPGAVAARFADASLRAGLVERRADRVACFFNWDDMPQSISLDLPGVYRLHDFWTGEERGRHVGGRLLLTLPPRTAQLVVCTPETL